MPELEITKLISEMINSGREAAGDFWPQISGHLEAEATVLAGTLSSINQRKLAGAITESEARVEFQMAQNAAEAWKNTLEGAVQLRAQTTINAALAGIKDYVQSVIGWIIFPG